MSVMVKPTTSLANSRHAEALWSLLFVIDCLPKVIETNTVDFNAPPLQTIGNKRLKTRNRLHFIHHNNNFSSVFTV